MSDFFHLLTSLHTADGLQNIIQMGGLVALTLIIFAETGLLVGFFLPGDSLLVTAGILTSANLGGESPILSLPLCLLCLTLAAILGDQLNYYLGAKTGHLVQNRPDSLLFKKKYLTEAETFYQKNGSIALIAARFIPILRTFIPFVAGVAKMRYTTFVRFNILGGVFWVFSLLLLGHFLGKTPLADQLHKVIVVVVFVSLIPLFVTTIKSFIKRSKAHS